MALCDVSVINITLIIVFVPSAQAWLQGRACPSLPLAQVTPTFAIWDKILTAKIAFICTIYTSVISLCNSLAFEHLNT